MPALNTGAAPKEPYKIGISHPIFPLARWTFRLFPERVRIFSQKYYNNIYIYTHPKKNLNQSAFLGSKTRWVTSSKRHLHFLGLCFSQSHASDADQEAIETQLLILVQLVATSTPQGRRGILCMVVAASLAVAWLFPPKMTFLKWRIADI